MLGHFLIDPWFMNTCTMHFNGILYFAMYFHELCLLFNHTNMNRVKIELKRCVNYSFSC